MSKTFFLQSTREGKEVFKFQVLEYNSETQRGIVLGSQGVKFETAMDKPTLDKYGYRVISEEVS